MATAIRKFPALTAVTCLAVLAMSAGAARAAQPAVGLGTADSYAVLSGSAVTNTGPSTVNGDLGVSPGTALTGFPPGTINGATHVADAAAAQAKADLTVAYDDAAGRTPASTVSGDLGNRTLAPGVYESGSSLGLTGTLTLDGANDPNAVFILKAGSSLTTASGSRVALINGAQACNVFWQIGSSATLGTSSVFAGNIIALTSISMNDGVTVSGRALARNGAVTLINDTISAAHCAAGTTGGTTTTGGGTTGGGTTTTGGDTPTTVTTTPPRFTRTRCLHRMFRATVSGRHIRRVVFSIGGRTLANQTLVPVLGAGRPSERERHRGRARDVHRQHAGQDAADALQGVRRRQAQGAGVAVAQPGEPAGVHRLMRPAVAAVGCLLALPACASSAQAAAGLHIPRSQALVAVFGTHRATARPTSTSRVVASVRSTRPITGARTTLPVLRRTTDDRGRSWVRVRLPGRVLGAESPPRTGWIRASHTLRSTTVWHIVVRRAARRVLVYRAGRRVHGYSAIVGKPSTPTPGGRYFVEENVRLSHGEPGGPFALATSARSSVLQEFEGGPGQIALHGRGGVGGQLGTAVSHGCVRLDAAAIAWLAARIAPGVPVTFA